MGIGRSVHRKTVKQSNCRVPTGSSSVPRRPVARGVRGRVILGWIYVKIRIAKRANDFNALQKGSKMKLDFKKRSNHLKGRLTFKVLIMIFVIVGLLVLFA